MLCGPVEIHGQIVEALEKGELVIFAGAGISMPAPSNLYSFGALADEIANEAGVKRQDNEPEDRFLGRLEDGEPSLQVHQLAGRLLTRENSSHTELHELLLRLFQSPDKVRIVTTNFDRRFYTAANSVFGDAATDLSVHCSPALPLGDDFSGLVYLHGVLHKPNDRCVMTDRDFGAAYLTDGWARRFLIRLFSKYTVLFVGYSHSDTVMNYLARGMPSIGCKFTFVPLGEETDWSFLRIKCVSYKKLENENQHIQITEACREWVKELELSPTKRHQLLQRLYDEGPASLNEQDKDFVLRCLRFENSSHGFLANEPQARWIEWMLGNKLLDPAFDPKLKPTDHQCRLMRWAIFRDFRESESVIWTEARSHGFSLNPYVSRLVAIRLGSREQHKDDVFKKWLAVLLHQQDGNISRGQFARLIESCRVPDEAEAALSILASQLKPKAETDPWSGTFLAEIGIESSNETKLTLNTCAHAMPELQIAWDEHLKPHLATFAFLAVQTFVNLLIEHRALTKLIQIDDAEDIVSRGRENVEPGHELGRGEAIDLIITGVVQALDIWLSEKDVAFDSLALAWDSLDVPILRRIVVHGQLKRPDWSADQKLEWLILQKDILASCRKREANLLIQRNYPCASGTVRSRVVDWLESCSHAVAETELSQLTFDVFSMLSWLVKHTGCAVAQDALLRVRKVVPATLSPWEHPEVGACSLSEDHFRPTAADLAAIFEAKTPSETVDALLTTIELEKHQHQKSDFIYQALTPGREDLEWAIGFQNALIQKGVHGREVWNGLFQLWRETALTPEQWKKLLESWIVIQPPHVEALDLVVDLLDGRITSQLYPIPSECHALAAETALHCWKVTAHEPHEHPSSDDVMFFVLNRAPGKLAHFWLQYAHLRRPAAADAWHGLPPEIVAALIEITSTNSIRADIASVMLCGYFDNLYRSTPEFVQGHLLPKLKWSKGDSATLWRWEAFLNSNCSWPLPFAHELLSSFTQLFDDKALSQGTREHALGRAAWLAVYHFEDPLKSGWFQRFLPLLDVNERVEYARLIGSYLLEAEWENQSTYWHRWVLDYCRQRVVGIPAALPTDEAREMLLWSLGSGDCFPAAVDTVLSWRVAAIEYSGPVLTDFVGTMLPEKYPKESARLLARVIELCEGPLAEESVASIFERLKASGAARDELEAVQNVAIKRGLKLEL